MPTPNDRLACVVLSVNSTPPTLQGLVHVGGVEFTATGRAGNQAAAGRRGPLQRCVGWGQPSVVVPAALTSGIGAAG